MKKTTFTLNSFMLIIVLFSTLFLFVTVDLYNMSDRSISNSSYPIGDTGYYVQYTTLRPSGIYAGESIFSGLVLEGYYGYDWGAAVCDSVLYCNEYHTTDLGFMTCDLVRIDLDTFAKKTVIGNAMLRGRCADGSLLCYEGVVIPDWFPETNPLYRLYAASDPELRMEEGSAIVCVLDPDSGAMLFRERDDAALTDEREASYLAGNYGGAG